jgi:hypothetical protein
MGDGDKRTHRDVQAQRRRSAGVARRRRASPPIRRIGLTNCCRGTGGSKTPEPRPFAISWEHAIKAGCIKIQGRIITEPHTALSSSATNPYFAPDNYGDRKCQETGPQAEGYAFGYQQARDAGAPYFVGRTNSEINLAPASPDKSCAFASSKKATP